MRKIILCLIMAVFLAGFAEASSVDRSFSSDQIDINETITVSLDVLIDDGATFYIIDEIIPNGWSITNAGTGDTSQAGHIKWVVISGAINITYNYDVRAPLIEGLYEFNGSYIFEGMGNSEEITGEIFVNVSNSQPVPDTTPPVISNVVNNSITNESAIVNWNTDEAADSLLEYGADLNLGLNVTDILYVTNHMINLGGLLSNTTYYYNITSCDNSSNCATAGPYSFTTLENSAPDTNPPLISNVRAESVGSNSATILWDSDENANSTVYYGNSTSLGERAGSSSMVLSHNIGLGGLDSDTLYYYKVESCDSYGNCANSSIYNFTTLTSVDNDLEVNYARGQILFDGGYASAGTLFWINVTSGANAGFLYEGSVDDSKIPGFLLGEGRFDTGDNIEFNTGDSFILSGENCNNVVNDIFVEGGNIVNLNCANQAPVVNIPDMNTSEDTAVNMIDLWQYINDDRDADANLTFELLSESNPGLIDCSLVSNRYINCSSPAADQFGFSALAVNVTDTSGLSASDSFNINVLAVNDAPVIGVMDQNVDEDSSIVVNLSIYASDIEGDSLSYYVTQQNIDQVSCAVNGEMLTITPAANWWGNAVCGVVADDGQLNSTEDVFNIIVANIADAPLFNSSNPIPDSSGMITWPEDTNYSINLTPYFINVDGLGLSYSAVGNINVNIVFNNGVATLMPDANWYGIDYVVINASNSAGSALSNNVILNVTPVDDKPIIAVMDQNVDEDSSLQINLSDYSSDVEGNSLSYYVTQQNINQVSCAVNGEMLTITPAANWWGNAVCGVVADDGQLNSTEDVFNIIVANIADAPLFNSSNPIPNQTWDEDNVNILDLRNYVIDIDGIDVSYSVSGNTNIAINIINGVATMVPALNWNGAETVVFNASNSAGSSLSNNVLLSVNPVNDAPVISNVSNIIVAEGDLVDVNPVVTDAEGDSVIVSYSSPLNSNGEWQTDFNDAGVYTSTVTANDGNGGISNVSFTITVNEFGNHNPNLTILNPFITVTEGEVVQVEAIASDIDFDGLMFIYGIPLNSTGGWQTGYSDAGVYNISVGVTDSIGGDIGYVFVTVLESGNHAPILNPISDISVTEGNIARIIPTAFDPDGDGLTFIFTNPLNASGEWQTGYSDAGSYQTLVTVTDGLLNDSQYVTINVLESGNHAPTLDHINDVTVTEGDIVQFNPSGSDPDGDSLYFTYTNLINSTGGWQTGFTDAGTHTVTVTANDGHGGTDSQIVYIYVNEFGNHNPVLNLINNITVVEGETFQIIATATDADGDSLIFVFDSPLDSLGKWQTGYTDSGLYATIVRVEDGHGGADSQTVYIEVLESGNHAPVLSGLGDITAVVCDTVVISPVVSDPDSDSVIVTISEPVGNDGIWDTCDYDLGEYKVIVTASDGDSEISQEITITLISEPIPHTNIDSLKILNEYVAPGEDLDISLRLGNDGMKDLNRARVTAIVQELGLKAQTKQFDIRAGSIENKRLLLQIPYDAAPGRYELRVTISNDESRRVKYRDFIVT